MIRDVENHQWIRSQVRRSIYATIAFAAAMAIACNYFRIHSTRDLIAYVGMSLECHPVWKELAFHRVRLGQSLEVVIAETNPISIDRHGRFVELGYEEGFSFTGIRIIAMDGKLVRAWAGCCTWDHTFFDAMTESDLKTFSSSLDDNQRTVEYMGSIIALREEAANDDASAVE